MNVISMYITENGQSKNLTVVETDVGNSKMTTTASPEDLPGFHSHQIQAISVSQYHHVSLLRKPKVADLVFDSAAAAVAILISFGIGCVTDFSDLKHQLKYPVSLVIGFCCQFLLMPLVAFGIAMILPLEDEMRFGLLCVACVPGGGLGHIAAIIGNFDLTLSLSMNMISIVAMLGTAPLWIFVLGQYFRRIESSKSIPIYNFEIWLASTFFSYAAGLVINHFKPTVADAILNWIIKPLLLLVSILYVTLGIYINMYVFEINNTFAIIGSILLPLAGWILGYMMSVICRQKQRFAHTIALETSSLNCLIVLAAIRFSLPQPIADLASAIPILVIFTIPGVYILLAIVRLVKQCLGSFAVSRKKKTIRQFSIVSGIINQANITALSAPLFVSENIVDDDDDDDDDDDESSDKDKVTVL